MNSMWPVGRMQSVTNNRVLGGVDTWRGARKVRNAAAHSLPNPSACSRRRTPGRRTPASSWSRARRLEARHRARLRADDERLWARGPCHARALVSFLLLAWLWTSVARYTKDSRETRGAWFLLLGQSIMAPIGRLPSSLTLFYRLRPHDQSILGTLR